MRLINYIEIRKLFDEEYKRTAQLIRDGETHLDNLAEGYLEADKVIFKLPDVDAVEVVRCKDCKHTTGSKLKCSKFNEIQMTGLHFCSYGERKDGAE